MGYGARSDGIDFMGEAHAIDLEEVPVVTRGGNGAIGEVDNPLNAAPIRLWLLNGDPPRGTVRLFPRARSSPPISTR